MTSLVDIAIRYARPVLSLFVFLIVAGAVTYLSIPREAAPDISIPKIYVSMRHDGISPRDAERLLVRPMEQELRSIEGVKEIRSTAYQNGGNVIVEFDAGFNVDFALADVRAKVDIARSQLPLDSDEPIVREINLSLFPILVVLLSGPVPERTLIALGDSLEQKVRAIPQVLKAELAGERKRQLDVIIDPARIRHYGLTAPQVINDLRLNNVLVASGNLNAERGSFSVNVPGLVETAEEFLNMPMNTPGGATITISDVAEIRQGFKDSTGFARINGERSIALEISKRTGANIIETVQEVRALVEQERRYWPEAIQVAYIQDNAEHIVRRVNDLQNSVILSVLLVMVVLMLALGLRASLLVSLTIPGAFLTGVLALGTLGFTINIVVLFALILSVGMLVDGAIVVTEYADRRLHLGENRRVAYGSASRNMAGAVIVSTLTTLLAFMPLLFWPGIVGEFMLYLPLTLIMVLTASLVMALIFLPTMGAQVGAAGALSGPAMRSLEAGEAGRFTNMGAVATFYYKIIKVSLAHPGRVVVGAVVALIATQFAYASFGRGVEFFPDVEPNVAIIQAHARGNLSVLEKDAIMRSIEKEVLALDGVESAYARTIHGRQGGGRGDRAQDVIGSVHLEFSDWRWRSTASEILAIAEQRLAGLAGVILEFSSKKAGPPVGKDVQVLFTSVNLDDITTMVGRLRAFMNQAGGFVNVEDQLSIPGVQWDMIINREEAARFKADVAAIGSAVSMATRGLKVSEYRPDDSFEEIDIMARFPPQARQIAELDRLFVHTAAGDVPVSNFVTLTAKPKVGLLHRTDGQRSVILKADVREGLLADDKVRELRGWLAANPPPPSLTVAFKGEDEEQKKASAFLSKAFGAALFLIALTLLTRFNNFFYTLLILSTIVMSTTGVMLGLLITGRPFGIVMTGIGVIALAGVVVNNNIILIDTWEKLRRVIPDPTEAILRTGMQRLRPVLLTSVTTILGLLPLVFGLTIDFIAREVTIGAPSTQWWRTLATSIVFGLAFATILTLVVTPSALMLKEKLRLKRAARLAARR